MSEPGKLVDQHGQPFSFEVEKKPYLLEFFAYETVGCGSPPPGLSEKLKSADDVLPYVHAQGKPYQADSLCFGCTTIEVLEFLKGLPLNNLVMAYVRALRPSLVRITGGEVTCDSYQWRVTIFFDEDKGNLTVRKITQEVQVSYGSGYDLGIHLQAAKEGKEPNFPPAGSCVGNTKGLERVNFE